MAAVLACAPALTGCGGDGGNSSGTPDGGDGGFGDAGKDGAPTPDAPVDASSEASTQDSSVDASDGGTDDATDGSTEAPPDGGADGGRDAGSPTATFSTAPIDLGAGSCGGAAASQTFDIQNTGTLALIVSDSVGGTVFSVSPASLKVAAGQTGTLTLKATVPQASTAGGLNHSLAYNFNVVVHILKSNWTPIAAARLNSASSPFPPCSCSTMTDV